MSPAEFIEEVALTVAETVRNKRVSLGPVVILSDKRLGELLRNAFEVGRDAGPERAPLAPVRHLHVVREAQG